MSREPRRRVVYGLGIPLAAALFIAAMLWAMSRVLLAVDPSVAPWVALLFAANILVASALASVLQGRRAFVMITAVIVGTIVAGGIAGAVVGEQPVEHLAAPGGHEGPPPPGGQAPPGGPGPTAHGGIALVAQDISFDTKELSLRAGKKTPIFFDNRDPFPHNLGIYTEPGGEELFQGTAVAAASTANYEVPPLDEGSYYFQCDFHPTEMNGTVKVG